MKPMRSCFLVLILTLLSVCSKAGAYTSGQFLTGANAANNNYSSVVVGPGNTFYGAWKELHNIRFATFNGTSWVEIPTASFTGAQVATALADTDLDGIMDWGPESIAVEGNGNIHVVFAVGTAAGGIPNRRGLAYGKYTASTTSWAFRKLFILSHASGFLNLENKTGTVRLDASGNPHVVFAWSDATPHFDYLEYAFFNGTTWNVSGNTNANDAQHLDSTNIAAQEMTTTAITFDGSGNLHCAYTKDSPSATQPDIWYIKRTGTTWGSPELAADVNNAGGVSIVVDAGGTVSIADRFNSTNTVNYRVTTGVSGAFTNSTVATYTYPGATTVSSGAVVMKINSAGRRIIGGTVKGNTSIGTEYRLVYETSPGVWAQEQAFTDVGTLNVAFPSLALRTTDNTVMGLFSRAVISPDSRNIYFATGIPTGFGGVAGVAVNSLNRVNPTPTNASTVNWTLTFASAVTGVTASNFSLTDPAATGSAVGTPTTGDAGVTWNVPVTTGATDGLLTLNLANATGLSAAISTALPFGGQSYTIDKTPPTVLSVVRLTPAGQTTNLTTVTFRVTYSEAVTLNAPAANRYQVVPVNSSNIVGTVTGVTGSGATRDVTVNLTSGTGEFKLRVID